MVQIKHMSILLPYPLLEVDQTSPSCSQNEEETLGPLINF